MVVSRSTRKLNRSLRWRTWAIAHWLRYMFKHAKGPLMAEATAVGESNIPRTGGVLVVFWHPTTRDPHNIFKVFPRNVAFMAGEFLFRGARGWLLEGLGQIKVLRGTDRAVLAREEAVRVIRAGGVVAAAPEGGCTPAGIKVGPFKTGPARIALETGAPVFMALPFGTTAQRYTGLRGWFAKPPVRVVFTEQLRKISEFAGTGDTEAVIAAYTSYLHGEMLARVTRGI